MTKGKVFQFAPFNSHVFKQLPSVDLDVKDTTTGSKQPRGVRAATEVAISLTRKPPPTPQCCAMKIIRGATQPQGLKQLPGEESAPPPRNAVQKGMFENTTQPSSRLAWTMTRVANKVVIPSTHMPPPHNDVRWSIFEGTTPKAQAAARRGHRCGNASHSQTTAPPRRPMEHFRGRDLKYPRGLGRERRAKLRLISQSQDNAPNVVRRNKKKGAATRT
ncbi:Aste57867_2041 [Aphanomyces stellatus]|uniref:Aste57867_2041 protein n=1 Tax=Aphanomyces stellatus TaxID=120398 RepID=A0A485K7P7_9STRA|nr:hypothetical protein As57867_002037 [Aphanomyces stellatus]VFT79245.1 Aste57867_2041 [Aphanomyces stellatus]